MALQLPQDMFRTAKPRCPYFGQCGGCALQDVPYEHQVQAKANALQMLLGLEVSIVPSPQPYAYRHRMDFVVAFGKIGLRKRGSYRTVVNLYECHLVSSRVSKLLPEVHEWIAELDIEGYDYIRHRGDLRYIVARHAFSSDQVMLIVVTASQETTVAPLLHRLRERAESVVWSVNPGRGDASFGEPQKTFGRKDIRQRIGNHTFAIGPNSFFQNNLLLADELFSEISEHAVGFVMDLYCGVGCVGICCSEKAEKLVGVESAVESVQLAYTNAEINGIRNAEFIVEDANRFLAFYRGPVPDTVIVDPPRSGLPPKLTRKLLRLAASKIVYVSCNPRAFAHDLRLLDRYELLSIKAFDMFPQTPHVELVAVLQKRPRP